MPSAKPVPPVVRLILYSIVEPMIDKGLKVMSTSFEVPLSMPLTSDHVPDSFLKSVPLIVAPLVSVFALTVTGESVFIGYGLPELPACVDISFEL